jgi:hypothetical protein
MALRTASLRLGVASVKRPLFIARHYATAAAATATASTTVCVRYRTLAIQLA